VSAVCCSKLKYIFSLYSNDLFKTDRQYFPKVKVQVKQSLYRRGEELRVPGSWGSQISKYSAHEGGRGQLKCDGIRAKTRFRLSVKRTSPFKSAGASVQSTTGSRGVCISGNNARYTMFRGSVKGTGYPLHSLVSSSLPHPASPSAITFQLESNVVRPT